MALSEKQEFQAMQRAVELGVASGKCKPSASGKSLVIIARKQPLSGILKYAREDIQTGDLQPEYEQAMEELRPQFETAGKRAATLAAKKTAAAAAESARVAAIDALLDRAYAGACDACIGQSVRDQLAARADMSETQRNRWNGIAALELRVRDERAQEVAALAAAALAAQQQAAQRAQQRAAVAATRVRMRDDQKPVIGETFWVSPDHRTKRVCTGYSKQPWQLSQQQIDDNDDFELEGVWLTYVYFREEEATAHEAIEHAMQKRDVERAEDAKIERAARLRALEGAARQGAAMGSNGAPDRAGFESISEKKPQSIWESGHFLGVSADEILYIWERPRGGDWMDEQTIYTLYRAPLTPELREKLEGF